ncbi:hypothetical protein [Burkholderia ubonensis]|uniref:hypothetical protein n=1 Tax=Burkholderia ubonensis TaxID=101571 RepID=UPI000A982073|nr:hypothetical protein [Burkholderia ubonensis]
MQTLGPKRPSRWPGVVLCGVFSGLVAAAALATPNAYADGKPPPHGHGQLPSGKEGWGKPTYPPSGPHPDDTVNKSTPKNRTSNQ